MQDSIRRTQKVISSKNAKDFLREDICFSDNCPANEKVSEIEKELLRANRDKQAFKDFITQNRENNSQGTEKIKNNEIFILKETVKIFQDHLEKIATQKQIATLEDRINTLEQRISDPIQNLEDISLLKVAESSFGFWDNPEDSIYDSL